MEIVKIDLVPSGVMPSCHASQYDIGREIRFLLTDGGEEYTLAGTETISIELRKPDGTSETIAIPNTSSNYVDWETSDGELDLSGVYLAEISIKNGDDVLGSANFIVKTEADAYDGADVRTVTVGPADICTFETTLPEPYQSVIINVLATGGNGTPDNPNPINGYSSANITRCGVNLFDKTDIADGYIDDTTGAVSGGAYYKHTDYIPVVGGQKIYIMTEQTTARWGAWYDKDKNYISGITNYSQTEATAPNNACFIRLTCKTTDTGNLDTFAVNYPSTDTYTPYNGQTYTVNFGQTVYGGVLDVTRGKLHVTHNIVDLGSLNWNYSSGTYSRFYSSGIANLVKAPETADTIPNMVASSYEVTSFRVAYQQQTNNVIAITEASSGSHGNINIVDNNYSDADVFKTAVAGQTLAYELATPFDIDLTPEVISAVVGENNVFADCGETTVKYLKAGA